MQPRSKPDSRAEFASDGCCRATINRSDFYDTTLHMNKDPVIIALDFESAADADRLVASLGDSAGFYKVGMELYAAAGMDYVRRLIDRGKRVFLDMKYYDIGETVRRATAVAARSGASFLTI